jgi:hypothetical protein
MKQAQRGHTIQYIPSGCVWHSWAGGCRRANTWNTFDIRTCCFTMNQYSRLNSLEVEFYERINNRRYG